MSHSKFRQKLLLPLTALVWDIDKQGSPKQIIKNRF